MLVLTRKIGQVIVIGGDTLVTVIGVRGGQVRLGIDAPNDVAVDRQEVRARRANSPTSFRPLAPSTHPC